jgi:uncharacterized protein involved in outer membrane biogenesis
VAIFVVALVWGWDVLIPLVAGRASASLGRPVSLAHLHITPGRILLVTADDVTIGNPPDWTGEPLARTHELRIQLDLWAYLRHGQMVVPLVALEQPQLNATQTPDGAANYKLKLAASSGPAARIGEVRIDQGNARIQLAKLQADMSIAIGTEGEGDSAKLVADAKGTYNAQPITGHMVGSALLGLEDATHPWPIDLRLQNGSTRVSLVGSVTNPMAPQATDLKLRLAGPDMALLGKLTGLPVPPTTPSARAEAQPKLIPDTPISVPKLHWANVHLTYRAQSIEGRSVPLDNLSVAMDLVNGQVSLHPISFGVGTGRISGTIELTPQERIAHARADVQFQRVDVSRLMAATHAFQGAGSISGSAVLDGSGNSLAQIVDNGQGELKLAMIGGDLSAVLVDLSGLEFGKAVLSALGMPTRTQVECFVTNAGLERGQLRIRAMVLDTGEAIVTGTGGADLRSEQVDMELKTESKHFSIGSMPTPLRITGTLKHPSIGPGAELAVRGGAAAGLGFVFPPLALLPTIQFGTGDDHRCDRILAQRHQTPGGQNQPRPSGQAKGH